MRLKPPHVVFAGCRLLPNSQGKPLRATYRVAGRHAAVVEAHLMRAIGLVHLRRSCCQWDAPERQFTGARGRAFMLTMASDEATVSCRTRWGLIRSFEITVITFTEEI